MPMAHDSGTTPKSKIVFNYFSYRLHLLIYLEMI